MATTTLTGTTGNDTLNAPGLVSTEVVGLAGADTITLSLKDDSFKAGKGNDLITLDNNIAASNVGEAGAGNDTVRILSAISFDGNLGFGAGNDSIFMTAGINQGTLRGNEGDDTIRLGVQGVAAFVGAGQGADSVAVTNNNNQTNSTIFGGKGADTINLRGTGTFSNTTIQASDGHDRINITAAAVFTNGGTIAMGKGSDSLNIAAAAAFVTVAGGGLDDTITATAAIQRGILFGDGIGAVTASGKTGGAADGNDLFQLTGGSLASSVSVIGGGGGDTIRFNAAAYANGVSAISIDGGDGNDLIGQSAVSFSGASAQSTLTGGKGADTIVFNAASSALAVLGGAGHDSLFVGTGVQNIVNVSVQAGAGNDTITLRSVNAGAMGDSAAITINAGAGTDKILFANTQLTGVTQDVGYDNATFSALMGNLAGLSSGDTFAITALVGGAAAGANFVGGAGQIAVVTGMSALSRMEEIGNETAVGSVVAIDSNGTTVGGDLILGVIASALGGGNGGASSNEYVFVRIIGGDTLLKVSNVGNINAVASNFGFSVARTNGNQGVQFTIA